jgi:hypothetical protein
MDNFQNYNTEVKGWSRSTLNKIKATALQQDIIHRVDSKSQGYSVDAMKVVTAMRDSKVARISFKLRRHLIFVHKGLGRDTPVNKIGTTNRKAKPFINDVLEPDTEQLANIVAEHTGDFLSNNILIH